MFIAVSKQIASSPTISLTEPQDTGLLVPLKQQREVILSQSDQIGLCDT